MATSGGAKLLSEELLDNIFGPSWRQTDPPPTALDFSDVRFDLTDASSLIDTSHSSNVANSLLTTNLRHLNLSANSLVDVSTLFAGTSAHSHFPVLESLDVSANKLTSLQADLPLLIHLAASSNDLVEMPNIDGLPELKV